MGPLDAMCAGGGAPSGIFYLGVDCHLRLQQELFQHGWQIKGHVARFESDFMLSRCIKDVLSNPSFWSVNAKIKQDLNFPALNFPCSQSNFKNSPVIRLILPSPSHVAPLLQGEA